MLMNCEFSYELKLEPRLKGNDDDPRTTFYWTQEGSSSFNLSIGPGLAALGAIPVLNVDLVRIALLVYAVDRSTPRKIGTTNWSSRFLSLAVPVSSIRSWKFVANDLARLLCFLTGDSWEINFKELKPWREQTVIQTNLERPSRVILVSGGADSALGILKSLQRLNTGEPHLLVSHVGRNMFGKIQRDIAKNALKFFPRIMPSLQSHEAIKCVRRKKQVDGSNFRNEYSSRSRSFLFLSLGLACASVHRIPVWIPDNGFTSLNPPLTPNRRGSLSTRSTHPFFLSELSRILEQIGVHSAIENPFARTTKGEMFRDAVRQFGKTNVSKYLSVTHSCGHSGHLIFGAPRRVQCGVCFGCMVRRAAFRASDVQDRTDYANPDVSDDLARWLDGKSVLSDVRRFVRRGVTAVDLASMRLPNNYRIRDARTICERGLEELRLIVP